MDDSRTNLIRRYCEPVAHFLSDPDITEVMINRYDDIFVERRGDMQRTDASFPSEQALLTLVQQLAGGTLDGSGVVHSELWDGSRCAAVLPPVSPGGVTVSIRVFPKASFSIDDLIERGAVTSRHSDLFDQIVSRSMNILVSGATGSGKTTLLNALTAFIPDTQRVITIEDVRELRVAVPNYVPLISSSGTGRDNGSVTMANLIAASLRLNPDRILVGEIRQPEAAEAFAQSLNSGHSGAITSIHANGPADALYRLENLVGGATKLPVEYVQRQVRSNLHVLIHAEKVPAYGRVVKEFSFLPSPDSDPVQLSAFDTSTGTHVWSDTAIDLFKRSFAFLG